MAVRFRKQPAETLDYNFDFSVWLPTGDSLTTASFSITPSGPTLTTGSIVGTDTARMFVSGGTDDVNYTLRCLATTTLGRIVEREIIIEVRETP